MNILNKRGTDMVHAAIHTKYQKYPSTTIFKNANVLSKINKSTQRCLNNMTPYDDNIITIHVRTTTLSEISHEQKD